MPGSDCPNAHRRSAPGSIGPLANSTIPVSGFSTRGRLIPQRCGNAENEAVISMSLTSLLIASLIGMVVAISDNPSMPNLGLLTKGTMGTTLSGFGNKPKLGRSEEHTSELQSLRHLVCRR